MNVCYFLDKWIMYANIVYRRANIRKSLKFKGYEHENGQLFTFVDECKVGEKMENSIYAILPSVVAIIFAAKTKKVFEAILLASLVGLMMLYRFDFIMKFVEILFDVMADPITGWIIMITGLFGSFLAILELSGGAEAFTSLVSNYANTQKKSLLITFFLGIILFIDEYLNVLTIGSAMKTVTDRNNVPREMLAYVINSTSTPICVLLPFSTWSIFFIGLMQQENILYQGSAISAYIKTIPFMLYAWVTVLMVPLVILGVIPSFGTMKKAWKNVDSSQENKPTMMKTSVKKNNVLNFMVPLSVLIVVTLMTDINLTVGIIFGLLTAFVLYLGQKIMSFDDYMSTFWKGFESMIVPIGIVLMAFCFKRVNDDLGLSVFILQTVKPIIIVELLPAVSFVLVAVLAFATGTLWGLVAIVLPIVITLVNSLGGNIFIVAGAVFSGAVFGSHACFYSDVVVLSARATDLEPVDHAVSLLPYALIAAVISIGGYLVLGLLGI